VPHVVLDPTALPRLQKQEQQALGKYREQNPAVF
jgi:hypothetical protein